MTEERFIYKTHHKGITTIIAMVVMLLLFPTSCKNEDKEVVEVAFDPETTYTMKTTDVFSLISDSGVTRYRLTAKEWYMFDKASDPYSYLPEGGFLEKFDSLFHVEFSIKADTIYRWEKKAFWKLIGNVEILNVNNEVIQTSLLYYDENEGRFYSDKFIRIEGEDRIITGIGFESNQDLTKYKIFNSAGEFDVNDTAPPDSTHIRNDSVSTQVVTPPAGLVAAPDTVSIMETFLNDSIPEPE